MMRSRLDKIIKRNIVQETENTDKGSSTNGYVSHEIYHTVDLFIEQGTNTDYRIARTKSSKPEASKRMVSAKKPSSAYPKARGLITK